MSEPVLLVELSPDCSILRVNPGGLSLLRTLDGPLHVVAIFGPKGTGKSFLMDQLAGQEKAFCPVPGIWLQCLQHPTKPGETLVLLDTQGLPEQVEKDEKAVFFKLFLLDVLLSNVFIYNTSGDGDLQKELDRLIYVTELPSKVHVLEDCPLENSFLLSSILPEFAWCLRNVTSDFCWEEMLQATDNNMDTLLSSPAALEDTPANFILRLFPARKAFCFHSPHVDGEDEDIFSSDLLHPVFQRQLGLFREYILSKGPKTFLGNTLVNGEVLSGLLERIVDVLSRDEPILMSDICGDAEVAFIWEGYENFPEPVIDPLQGAPAQKETPRISQPSAQETKVPQHSSSPSCAVPSRAQSSIMEGPMCLIENKPGENLQVSQKALSILQNIQEPVVVVAIVGLYRTGKSYLMNRLAGKSRGFSLGPTVEANTKGIWMWCLPHPKKQGHTLVLLDTEGLGDVRKSNVKNDSWIFALSVLLSSTFVYNSMGIIDNYALEKLHYVTELTEHIKVKASAGQSCDKNDGMPDDFIWFFPTFIWAVRDFTLQLKLNGRPISEDEYLEFALERTKDAPEKQDLAKKCLRQYFPNRKCFVFDRPASRQKLEYLDDLPEENLNPDFLEEACRFCRYIHENAQAKVIQNGHVMTGTLLGCLAVTYVDAIQSGDIPCIENAVLALAQIENSAAMQDALRRYDEMVLLLSTLPTESVEELLRLHALCEEEAIKVFLARTFKDEGQEYQRQLGHQLHSKFEELCRQNEQASQDRCQAVLMELFEDLEETISRGSYSVPGGYQRFLDDREEKLKQYHLAPEKGLMASRALQEFLNSKETVAQSILQADRTLTDKEKEIEVKKVQAEASEREAQLQRQMREQAKQMAQEAERSYKEHEKQLWAKMEEDRKKMLAEHEKVLTQKLQEQARLQREGFQQEVAVLQNEIQNLRHQMNQSKRRSWCVIA
ncbi:guanylate-binding protein 1-like isoform X2 [Hemicordylus capensis]|uniref:guanylate-binding protein 1-like isoform X2 n=1 Tax=Hemicordylus capensis TaxID=884348 RepID=UPI002302FB9D|nr:guanylate-binding protein 1-like isoform X2 [Hemicordylus capensis]